MSDLAAPRSGPSHDDGVSLPRIAAALLRGRTILAALAITGMVLGVLAARLPEARFRSVGSFTPQQATQNSMGNFAGLAGRFGVQLGGLASGGNSPEFYGELLRSREILEAVMTLPVEDPEGQGTTTLVELSRASGDSDGERLDEALDWFRQQALGVSVDIQTSIVTFSVTTSHPEVSRQIAQAVLDGIHQFNVRSRQTDARAERSFLETRVEDAQENLLTAEARLQRFLQQNRQFDDSPELLFEYERLEREVAMRQQVYTGLVEAFEQARIQEVRNTPVITVVETPVTPSRREARNTILKALVGLLLGLAVGAVVVVSRSGVLSADDRGVAEFRAAWREARDSFGRFGPRRDGGV